MDKSSLLRDLLVVCAVAIAVVALLARLRVPTIAGFIVVGALTGPNALALVADAEEVSRLAEIGVALLLFSIGLDLRTRRSHHAIRLVLLGGALQVGISVAAGTAVALAFGVPAASAVFIGFLVALSSTAVVLRGLEGRGELASPHGSFTLGVLIFQDLAVVPMILLLPLLSGAEAGVNDLFMPLLKAVAVVLGVVVAARVLVEPLLRWAAATRERDLFVLTVLLICLGTAWLVARSGLSLAIGAFLAGLMVAGSEYRHQALSDLIPFREVLASLFFVSIGMFIDPRALVEAPAQIFGLTALLLLGKALIAFVAAVAVRLPIGAGVMSALALSQVGEFSFVLLQAAGDTPLVLPFVTERFLPAAILSMLITPLLIAVAPTLAAGLVQIPRLSRLSSTPTAIDAPAADPALSGHVLIAGRGLAGKELARALRSAGVECIVVDLNPRSVAEATEAGERALYGDITSPAMLEQVAVTRAREVVLVINDPSAVERAIKAVRHAAPQVHIIARHAYLADIARLRAATGRNADLITSEVESAVAVVERVLARHGVQAQERERHLDRIRRAAQAEPRSGPG